MRKKPELLAPAGNFEKLKYALHYGADAVYCAGQRFGLRAKSDNFDEKTLKEAVEYTHALGKKIYVTVNMIPHNDDFEGLPIYLKYLEKIGVDAVLASDPGVILMIKEEAPSLKIALSTQANNVNYKSAEFWYGQGIRRIVLARELSLKEIKTIVEKNPKDLEIEVFVHGAMCISYSGRCLLSHYMTGRDGNKGDCAQPCRWRYHLKEVTRPEDDYIIEEDETGSFIFNSKDLCLVGQIPDLINAGVSSFKIEGRMKSLYYVATVVGVYRKAIDAYMEECKKSNDEKYVEELKKVSHRNYTTAFFNHKTEAEDQNYSFGSYTRTYDFVGIVKSYDEESGLALVEQRNKVSLGDTLEIMTANSKEGAYTQKVTELYDLEKNSIQSTPHPQMLFYIKTGQKLHSMDILRKVSEKNLIPTKKD